MVLLSMSGFDVTSHFVKKAASGPYSFLNCSTVFSPSATAISATHTYNNTRVHPILYFPNEHHITIPSLSVY